MAHELELLRRLALGEVESATGRGHELDQVLAEMEVIKSKFPDGMTYDVSLDATLPITAGIRDIVVTLVIALLLVILVVFIFIQDWRATLIPTLAIPVSLIGAFIFFPALGFTINVLSLLGLVLAIGIVVDDAIVVVEATVAHMERGLDRKAAAIKAMSEVSGPVVATTLVLLAVFVPAAFMPGITGQLYRQFALTIAVATVFSSINALTMSPALAALVLRLPPEKKNAFFRGFDNLFSKTENRYTTMTKSLVRRTGLMLLLAAGLAGYTGWQFTQLPTGFLPTEDQGYLMVHVQLPDAAAQERTGEVLDKVDAVLAETEGVADWVIFGGFNLIDGTASSNTAVVFVTFTPWDERKDPSLRQEVILAKLQGQFQAIQESILYAFLPPAINGLGVAGGFQFQLEDRGGIGLEELNVMLQEILQDGEAQSGMAGLNSTFRIDVPQLFAEVDRTKAKTLGISLSEVFGTLQAYLGSAYVNDFNLFGRVWKVMVQADEPFLVRVHVQNSLSDLFGAQMDDIGWPLRDAMKRIADNGEGIAVVLGQHESPKDLVQRIQFYNEHDKSGEPVTREERHELRTYGIGAQILTDLGVKRMRVLSAPMVVHGLSGFGLEVVEYVSGK